MTPLAHSAVAILDKLVAFDTVSRHSNLALIDWVAHYLRGHGVEPIILPSRDGAKANLFATIGPKESPGVLLSAHTDVVPVDGQSWRHDPFKLVEADGRLYARGVADMKGYVACILALAPRLKNPRLPVHIALSYDEELGCFGAPGLVEHMRASGLKPAIAFIGEPSRMQVVNGHKGSCGMLTEVTGVTTHSSRPDLGVNAAFAGMDIMAMLRRRAESLAAEPDSVGVFEPPYTTISVGVVRAGAMRNAVPADCHIEWDIRVTRPELLQAIQSEAQAYIEREVLPAMRARSPEAKVVTEVIYDVPLLLPETDGAAERLAKRLTGASSASTVPYGSEAGIFQRAGLSTVICGPGDILQAHTADEWIAVSEIEACMAYLDRLADRLSAGDIGATA
jgi:acetylornithine deacetylase